jgi:hypothetical protein
VADDGATTTRQRKLDFEGSLPSDSKLLEVVDYTSGANRHRETLYTTHHQYGSSLTGKQVTVSENHPRFMKESAKHRGVAYGDQGGDFFSQKSYAEPFDGLAKFSTSIFEPDWATTQCFYEGLVLPWNGLLGNTPFPPPSCPSETDIIAFGTTAIANCKPTQQPANLATALFELRREGLPDLVGVSTWKSRTSALRKGASGELLNWEFGIKPLANDIADVATVIDQRDVLIKQYLRDLGKNVRRKYVFPPDIHSSKTTIATDVSPAVMGPTAGGMYDYAAMNRGKVIRERVVTNTCWFSGAFTYHLPIDPITMKQEFKRNNTMRKLLGVDLTPDTIWNLTPWSWAADWFYNTGDIISNLQSSANDLLVLRYGYVMCHTLATDTYTFEGPTGLRSGFRPAPVVLVTETRQRYRANPFGFGKKWGSLSPRQLAIAAALGINRT